MANLDTAAKRKSGINVASPWRSESPFPDGTIGSGDRQASAFMYSGILSAAFIPTIMVILTDAANAIIAGLTGLRWAWWDQPVVSSQVAPSVTGTGATTDGSGVFSVTSLPGSALAAGQVGWIEITDSDGTTTQSPVGKVAAGPIRVA